MNTYIRNTCINTITKNGEEGKANFSFFWFVFLLTMLFPPMYLPIDVRLVIAFIWIVVARKIVFCGDLQVAIVVLAFYSIIVVGVNDLMGNNVDVGVVAIRYFRALIMSITISSLLSTVSSKEIERLIISLAAVLTLHSTIIFFEIIFPNFNDIMYIFSGKTRIFYRFRANGFVNSFDFAGFYSNIGIIINAMLAMKRKNKKYCVFLVICIIATLFTSRLNMLFCIMVLYFVRRKIKKSSPFLKTTIDMLFITIAIIAISMWAITTDTLAEFRSYLFEKFDWMTSFYNLIRNTYSDDILSKQISYQFNISNESVFQIIGTGQDPNRDPGYIQMLYGIGIVGTIIAIIPYVTIAYKILSGRKYDVDGPNGYYEIVTSLLGCVAVYELLLNIKILFLYSTGAFELLFILYILQKNRVGLCEDTAYDK